MPKAILYHNPRCSKSRQTKALLDEEGVDYDVIEYLKDPPDAATLRKIVKMLGIRPIDLARKKEAPFEELGLADKAEDDDAILAAMVEHPVLIERPIMVKGKQARIGRPPEQVRDIL